VEVLFVGFAPLSVSFSINIYPENPIAWKIITSAAIKDGVLSGDDKDLHDKILGESFDCNIFPHGHMIIVDVCG